jgi:hypothetical protein
MGAAAGGEQHNADGDQKNAARSDKITQHQGRFLKMGRRLKSAAVYPMV